MAAISPRQCQRSNQPISSWTVRHKAAHCRLPAGVNAVHFRVGVHAQGEAPCCRRVTLNGAVTARMTVPMSPVSITRAAVSAGSPPALPRKQKHGIGMSPTWCQRHQRYPLARPTTSPVPASGRRSSTAPDEQGQAEWAVASDAIRWR